MPVFDLYPAIDLRNGRVVRLQEGDPERLTTYDTDPTVAARRWLDAGARWLHVVNLDGALGQPDEHNQDALAAILDVAADNQARVQFGGGMRSLASVRTVLHMGVARVVLGTVAVERPGVLKQALDEFGAQKVAVAIDARHGEVRVHGWQTGTALQAVELAQRLAHSGVEWVTFTDVARDGLALGLNINTSQELARRSGLNVIASGGVKSLEEVRAAQQARLSGVIVGRALYEGQVDLHAWFQASSEQQGS